MRFEVRDGNSFAGRAFPMKRIIVSLSCAVGASGVFAGDNLPAATLGSPAATLGKPVARGQIPELKDKDGKPIAPMPMPKAAIGESSSPKTADKAAEKVDPKAVPMPGTMPGTTPGTIMPGAPTPYGPVMTPGTSGPMMTGPITSGPILSGPVVYPPTPIPGVITSSPECNSPWGCPIPTAGGVNHSRFYGSAEYLFWWIKGFSTPPLVTAGPPASNGILGQPGTTVLYPNDPITANVRQGFRVSLGYWLSPKWAIDGSFFFTGRRGENFAIASDELPGLALARPFTSANTGQNTSELVGFPNVLDGFVSVRTRSQMYGFELNAKRNLWDNCNSRLDLIGGYRYVQLRENLDVNEQVRSLPGAAQFNIPVGIEAAVSDGFRTANHFHGGQIGVAYERTWGRWVFDGKAKVALGVVHQSADVVGTTTILAGNRTPNQPGGLLALNSNSGHIDRNVFGVVPEVSLNLGYNVTDHLRIFVGYNFLYMNNVIRPGGLIDSTLDERSIPDFLSSPSAAPVASQTRPLTKLSGEDVWIQGVNFGLLFRW
jgi:Putative beta barrel porin-7 (BBP7)